MNQFASLNSCHASDYDNESSNNGRENLLLSAKHASQYSRNSKRTASRRLENDKNFIQSSFKRSAERNQESDVMSSHVSAAEFLSGDSGESYDDDLEDSFDDQDDEFKQNQEYDVNSPGLERKMILGFSKSSQVLSVLDANKTFELKANSQIMAKVEVQEQQQQKKFLAIPSFFAGICLGLNNFLLGLISDQGLSGAFIFSVGAIYFSFSYKIIEAFRNKKKTGAYWNVENSNLFKRKENSEQIVVNWTNVFGLFLRVSINIIFQSTTMLAFMYASRASINQGLITSLFSTYCVFTSFIFYFLFNEKLKLKFLVGIGLMLTCVILVSISQSQKSGHHKVEAAPSESNSQIDSSIQMIQTFSNGFSQNIQNMPVVQLNLDHVSQEKAGVMAISLGLFTPFMISIFISVSRYWSQVHGYKSIDYTADTFMCMGLVEIIFFVQHQMNVGYTVKAIVCGVGASFGQIMGTLLMIYASTYGLAGPSSAMVQVQGLFHTMMSAIFLGVYPSGLQSVGLGSAILGATIMSVDIPNPFAKSKDEDCFTKSYEGNRAFSPSHNKEHELHQYHSHSTEHSHSSTGSQHDEYNQNAWDNEAKPQSKTIEF